MEWFLLITTIATILGGFLSSFGRRFAFILTDIFSIFSVVVQVYSIYNNSYDQFVFARLLIGICTGFNSVLIPLYIKEMSPDALQDLNKSATFLKEL